MNTANLTLKNSVSFGGGQTEEKPILFTGDNVRAILEGRKHQTRRVPKSQPTRLPDGSFHWVGGRALQRAGYQCTYVHSNWDAVEYAMLCVCPYGRPGDRLWVRETFYCDDYRYPNIPEDERTDPDWRLKMIYYRADGEDLCNQIPECEDDAKGCWRPAIFLPRWASRILLEVVSVRVEQLHAITESDAEDEGCAPALPVADKRWVCAFRLLWDRINGKRHPWAQNNFVYVVKFKEVDQSDPTLAVETMKTEPQQPSPNIPACVEAGKACDTINAHLYHSALKQLEVANGLLVKAWSHFNGIGINGETIQSIGSMQRNAEEVKSLLREYVCGNPQNE